MKVSPSPSFTTFQGWRNILKLCDDASSRLPMFRHPCYYDFTEFLFKSNYSNAAPASRPKAGWQQRPQRGRSWGQVGFPEKHVQNPVLSLNLSIGLLTLFSI